MCFGSDSTMRQTPPDKLLRNLLIHKASLRQLIELLHRPGGGWGANHALQRTSAGAQFTENRRVVQPLSSAVAEL